MGLVGLTFVGYVSFAVLVGRCAPSFGVSVLYLFLLRRQIPSMVSINFELPKWLPDLLDYFNQLDELKIQVSFVTLRLEFAILCLICSRMNRHFKRILQSQSARGPNPLVTIRKQPSPSPKKLRASPNQKRSFSAVPQPPSSIITTTQNRGRLSDLMEDCSFTGGTPRTAQNPFGRYSASGVGQHYATPPPSFASMRSSTSNSTQPSCLILRQSRLNYLKSGDSRSMTRTPDTIADEISPFDSVSNYDEEEPMETSFGETTVRAVNTSFGSDVGSILSATLNTSVQVITLLIRVVQAGT